MSSNQQGNISVIRTWFRQTILYNKGDIKQLIKNLVIIVGCTAILAWVWDIGWDGGQTFHVALILEHVIPGPTGPLYTASFGFLLGLVSIFWLDAYKRLQGLFLLIPAIVALGIVIIFAGRFDIVWTLPAVLVGLLGFVVGLSWGGLVEWVVSTEKPEMKRGFQRLITVVGIIGVWGIIEATVNYDPPIIFDPSNPIIVSGIEIPMSIVFPAFGGFASETILTFFLSIFIYAFVLFGLVTTLEDFTEYEMNKDILILGPDRAGKTWVMAGAGYSLRQRAMADYDFEKPELNPSLQAYHDIFVNEDFDNDDLDANEADEFDFFSFTFEHGVLPRRRVRVNTIDYAGEYIKDVNLDDPWNEFEQVWDNKDDIDTDSVPSFEKLEQLNWNNKIKQGDIPSLLSVMIAEYDAIALTTPADEFALEFEDDDLPDHLDPKRIKNLNNARATERTNVTGTGYFQTYELMLDQFDDKDIFFLITMSDTFLETYKDDPSIPHVDPKGNPNWQYLRSHVLEKIREENDRTEVNFMIEPQANRVENIYPVYFEPGKKPYYTSHRGQFKPKLNTNEDEYYPLRGLKFVLKRMGR